MPSADAEVVSGTVASKLLLHDKGEVTGKSIIGPRSPMSSEMESSD